MINYNVKAYRCNHWGEAKGEAFRTYKVQAESERDAVNQAYEITATEKNFPHMSTVFIAGYAV